MQDHKYAIVRNNRIDNSRIEVFTSNDLKELYYKLEILRKNLPEHLLKENNYRIVELEYYNTK
jgi:hypothetical protein